MYFIGAIFFGLILGITGAVILSSESLSFNDNSMLDKIFTVGVFTLLGVCASLLWPLSLPVYVVLFISYRVYKGRSK